MEGWRSTHPAKRVWLIAMHWFGDWVQKWWWIMELWITMNELATRWTAPGGHYTISSILFTNNPVSRWQHLDLLSERRLPWSNLIADKLRSWGYLIYWWHWWFDILTIWQHSHLLTDHRQPWSNPGLDELRSSGHLIYWWRWGLIYQHLRFYQEGYWHFGLQPYNHFIVLPRREIGLLIVCHNNLLSHTILAIM